LSSMMRTCAIAGIMARSGVPADRRPTWPRSATTSPWSRTMSHRSPGRCLSPGW
jgi:hypothetical protein